MKKILTDSRCHYHNTEVFSMPPFSEVKKAYIVGSNLFIIYEFPIHMEFHQERKLVNIKVQESVSPNYEFGYQYLDTQIIQKTELQNSSFSNNVQLNMINIDITYHFFIQEHKPLIESRDEKIENVLK